MQLSLRWAERCEARLRKLAQPGQALFGIVQGGVYPDLRSQSAEALIGIGFDGYAIGGLAVGEGQAAMLKDRSTTTVPLLPADSPRYLMGVGTPDDMLKAVARGIDMFDCVMPTRTGRHGLAFTWGGKVNLRNARHAEDIRAARSRERMPGRARLFARLSASPRRVERDARRHAAVLGQYRLLSGADGAMARSHRRRPLRRIRCGCAASLRVSPSGRSRLGRHCVAMSEAGPTPRGPTFLRSRESR